LGECYESKKGVLGEKHVDTLGTQWWLGLTLYEEGKYEEAEKMLYECYEGTLKVLGERHEDALKA
jgi:hypothetical protein